MNLLGRDRQLIKLVLQKSSRIRNSRMDVAFPGKGINRAYPVNTDTH
jgi:hypothetical protein